MGRVRNHGERELNDMAFAENVSVSARAAALCKVETVKGLETLGSEVTNIRAALDLCKQFGAHLARIRHDDGGSTG
jgi:hypothetical protein